MQKLILPGLLALAAAFLLFRIDAGTWDPWEMDRAHVARQLAGNPKALFILPADGRLERFNAAWSDRYFIAGVEAAPVALPPAGRAVTEGGATEAVAARLQQRQLDAGLAQVRAELYHGIFIDAGLLLANPQKGWENLEAVTAESPGAAHHLLAESATQCEEARQALEKAMVEQAANALIGGYRLLPPDEDVASLAAARAGSYPFVVDLPCVTEEAGLEEALSGLSLIKWTRVQFRGELTPATEKNPNPPTALHSVPPLDYWLTALSFKAIGFSEASSRLPNVLFGLATLLVVVLGIGRLLGRETGLMAGAVLLAMPLFLGQARNLAGEMSYTFFLSAGLVLWGLVVKEGARATRLALLLGCALALFLAKGLFGLGTLLLVMGGYALVCRDWRWREVTLPLIVGGALFLTLVLLVQLPSEWTFFGHFKFMNRLFQGGPLAERRTFEYFVRQAAFALMPWTLLLPLACARLIGWGEERAEGNRRLEVLVLLWFALPFALHSALLPGFAHLLFPAATAAAVAVAIFLRVPEAGERNNRFHAFVALGIAAVVLANLFKSTQHLFAFLATDPEFGAGAAAFPEDHGLGGIARLLLGLSALLVLFHYGRGGDILRTVLAFFRRPLPFWMAVWLFAMLFVARLVGGLASRYQLAFNDRNAGQIPAGTYDCYRELFAQRLETFALYAALGALALVAFFALSPIGQRWLARTRRLAPIIRPVRWALALLGRDRVGLPLALALGLAALVDLLSTFKLPAGIGGTLVGSPSFLAALAIACGTPAVAFGLLIWPRARRSWSVAAAARMTAGAVVVALLVVTSTFFRQTDLGAADIWILSLASVVVLGCYSLPRLVAAPTLFHLTAWGALAALAATLFLPLAIRWPAVEAAVFPRAQVHYLDYLFGQSLLTWLPLVLLAGVAAVRLTPWAGRGLRSLAPVDRLVVRLGLWNPVRWPEAIQERRVFLPLALALGLGFGGCYAVKLLPDFSREVSQKHILELYYASEERTDLGPNIFKYQESARAEHEDRNFYTAPIPAISGQTDLNRVLLANEDAALRVSRASSHPGPALVHLAGFDAAADSDADGKRDFPAFGGLATTIAPGRLVDEEQNWQPDQWRGFVLTDWRGQPHPIQGNDATTLLVESLPVAAAGRLESRLYLIDSPDSPSHQGSAAERHRNYIVLSQEAFSNVNFTFRSKSGGLHIPVLDGTNASFLLATSFLLPGESNHNRFANATFARERFARLEEWTKAPAGKSAVEFGVDPELAEHGQLRSGMVNFNDQIVLRGYQMKSSSVARGQKVNLRLFFECTGKVATSWKIFIHMDSTGDSNRINGDHWPLNLSSDPEDKKCAGCWRTNHWMEGDIILDDYKTEVPLGSPSGIYNVYMGFFTPGSDKRLKVIDFDRKRIRHDGKDRVQIGTFEVN